MAIGMDTETAGQPYAPPTDEMYDSAMAKERLVSAQEARDNFRQILDEVESGEVYAFVLRRSKVAACIVPEHWARRMIELGIPDEGAIPEA